MWRSALYSVVIVDVCVSVCLHVFVFRLKFHRSLLSSGGGGSCGPGSIIGCHYLGGRNDKSASLIDLGFCIYGEIWLSWCN